MSEQNIGGTSGPAENEWTVEEHGLSTALMNGNRMVHVFRERASAIFVRDSINTEVEQWRQLLDAAEKREAEAIRDRSSALMRIKELGQREQQLAAVLKNILNETWLGCQLACLHCGEVNELATLALSAPSTA